MAASPARAVAFDILLLVQQRESYASELLHSHRLETLAPTDRALVTEIVMGVLRWQSMLDAEVGQYSSQKLEKLDTEVLIALRIAAYQMQFTRVPARAAVNESVELVKRARKRSAMPFTNAVLRKLANAASKPAPDDQNTGADLARRYAHPEWLVERWRADFGDQTTEAICEFDQQVPTTILRLVDGDAEAELRQEGIEVAPGALLRNARTLLHGDVARSKSFSEGRVAIQDEGSQLVAALVGRGLRLLDCCAAPGGKTAALAERNPEAKILAVEIHAHRARLLRERVPAKNVEVLTTDIAKLDADAEFDRVLADVPCSGTGTLARNPEIKWKLRQDDIADLQNRQKTILAAAMSHVAAGGRVVYSTCSLEPEENEGVVQNILETRDQFRVVNVREELERLKREGELTWSDMESLARGPFLRTIPGVHRCDGFFAAILERVR